MRQIHRGAAQCYLRVVALHPGDAPLLVVGDLLKVLSLLCRAFGEVLEPVPLGQISFGVRLASQTRFEIVQPAVEREVSVSHGALPVLFCNDCSAAGRKIGQSIENSPECCVHRLWCRRPRQQTLCFGEQSRKLAVADPNAEEGRGSVFDLVGLVQDHAVVVGKNATGVGASQGKICEKEMMVDDHDLGRLGFFLHLRDKAVPVVGTWGAESGVAR